MFSWILDSVVLIVMIAFNHKAGFPIAVTCSSFWVSSFGSAANTQAKQKNTFAWLWAVFVSKLARSCLLSILILWRFDPAVALDASLDGAHYRVSTFSRTIADSGCAFLAHNSNKVIFLSHHFLSTLSLRLSLCQSNNAWFGPMSVPSPWPWLRLALIVDPALQAGRLWP